MDAVFQRRLEAREEEMKQLFFGLFLGDQQAYDYLVNMLEQYYEQRPKRLKDLDAQREADPQWYKGNDMLGMLMYTNCFAGNLKGVCQHLDYIKECGVNYLHLMPLLESPEGRSDGGYAVSDFRKVQPELGTMEDLAVLADECHAHGMSLCLDFVMNHTGEDHEWAKRSALPGEKECRDRYFFFDTWDIPNEYEKTVPQVYTNNGTGKFHLE